MKIESKEHYQRTLELIEELKESLKNLQDNPPPEEEMSPFWRKRQIESIEVEIANLKKDLAEYDTESE